MQTAAFALERLADEEAFSRAVMKGFSSHPKSLPCRYLYDARGSALFEMITQLPEYYLTRVEIGLLETHAAQIMAAAGKGAVLVEFGSGSSRKTRILLDHAEALRAYIPIDISGDALFDAASELAQHYPDLAILPLHADFANAIQLPISSAAPRLGFFPGSTIGNLSHAGAEAFLRQARRLLGRGSRFLVGVDLRKDEETLTAAYNDAAGVTAAFNLNILERINRELDGDIDVSRFRHEAVWDAVFGRIQSYLVSTDGQRVEVMSRAFQFMPGERIHTENSHKYTLQEFRCLAGRSGWETERVWTDDAELFSLHLLRSD